MRTILFLPNGNGAFKEMIPIAKAIQEKDYHPKFLFPRPTGYMLEGCEEHSFSWWSPNGAADQAPLRANRAKVGDLPHAWRRWMRRFPALDQMYLAIRTNSSVANLLDMRREWKLLQQDLHCARQLLEQERPIALVLIGDRHVGLETALVKRANERCIPSLIVPFAQSFPTADATMRLRSPAFERIYSTVPLWNRFMAYLAPHWIYEYKQRRIFFIPPPRAVPAALLGLMPGNPWTLAGGAATAMALESQAVRDMFLEAGADSSKMIVTGKPSHDTLYACWRDAHRHKVHLCAELNIEPDIPFLLCSLPQLAEGHVLSWPEYWTEIRFLAKTLSQVQHVNVVLALHPTCDYEQYRFLAEEYPVIVSQGDINELIPVADVYIATLSSTMVLAMVCQIPAVCVDFYGHGYDVYDGVRGIVSIRDKPALLPTLRRILADRMYYDQLVQGQTEAARYWACFDGRATERVIALLDELIDGASQHSRAKRSRAVSIAGRTRTT